jgi:glycosyltransferase involved in cell wall biosynthesis
MYDLLAPHCECHLYAETIEGSGRGALTRAETGHLLADPRTVAVYHHSAYWADGEELLASTWAPLVFKYHNITPPSYFADFEPYWNACVRGREQVYRFVHRYRHALWLSDSLYSLVELGIDLLPNRAIVPPFLGGEVEPNGALLKQLAEDETVNVLSVGRMAPNKGHRLLVRVVEAYKRMYGGAVTALIVGKLDLVCRSYYESVVEESRRAGVEENIRYLGSVSDEDLLSYYLGSDVYLCSSDHEGFCVPVVEAQRARLPVVAKLCGAVRETLGPGQILLGNDPTEYAHAIQRLCRDEAYHREIAERGYNNYRDRFTYERIAEAFLGAIESYLGGPCRGSGPLVD